MSRSVITPAAVNRVKARRNREKLRRAQRGVTTLRIIDALCTGIAGVAFFLVVAMVMGLWP